MSDRITLAWEPLENTDGIYGWQSSEFTESSGVARWHIHRDTYRQPSRRSRKDRGRLVSLGWWVRLEVLDGDAWLMRGTGVYADGVATNFSNIKTAKKACEIATAELEGQA